jgi:hypothetical protein
MLEIAVQRKNIAGAKLVGHRNQTRIGKIGWRVAVLAENLQDLKRGLGNTEGDSEQAALDVRQEHLNSLRIFAQQKTTLDDHCFAGHNRPVQIAKDLKTLFVPALSLVQKRIDNASVKQDWLH